MRRAAAIAVLVLAGCRSSSVSSIAPAISLDSTAIDFHAVHVATQGTLALGVRAATQGELEIEAHAEGDGFTVVTSAGRISGLSRGEIVVGFTPPAVGEFTGMLVITSNDPAQSEARVTLAGRGAYGALEVSPGQITFPPEPYLRLSPVDVMSLPTLTLHSVGEVAVTVTGFRIGGPDAPAFSFVGNATLPDGGLSLAPGTSVSVPLHFAPTSDLQKAYAAEVVIGAEPPGSAEVIVPLIGALRQNAPPTVCVNLTRIVPPGSAPRSYDDPGSWAPMPLNGYDFGATRAVPPRAEVQFSALGPGDESTCTSDPDDGRLGLSWEWRVLESPPGSTPLQLDGERTPRLTLRPFAIGRYRLQLDVSDAQSNLGSATATFTVALQTDLLAQLEWAGSPGVDLDVHLVRPYSTWFQRGTDINGWALSQTDGGEYDWGQPGSLDDPRLNVDDTGQGPLLENVSLDAPENDPICTAGPCPYHVLVHHFRDARTQAGLAPCTVDAGIGCHDGEACGCAAGTRCVANAAPDGVVPIGPGRCVAATAATVRVFLNGASTPAQTMSVDLAAPCALVHVADIRWPARGSDAGVVVTVVAPVPERWGVRQAGSLQCAPNSWQGSPWYAPEP